MFQWPIKGELARGRRPGVEGKRGSQVAKSVVDAWIKEAKAQGIRSVICLLDERQLRFYEQLEADLVSYYKSRGLNVVHINVPNMRKPPLSDQHLKEVWSAYRRQEKPVLVHCSAGIGRTGAAVRYIKSKKTDRLLVDFGQMYQFHEIHSPFAGLGLGNKRLRSGKQSCDISLSHSRIQSGLLQPLQEQPVFPNVILGFQKPPRRLGSFYNPNPGYPKIEYCRRLTKAIQSPATILPFKSCSPGGGECFVILAVTKFQTARGFARIVVDGFRPPRSYRLRCPAKLQQPHRRPPGTASRQ